MANLRPLRLQAFTCRIMLRLQQDEDGIKGWEATHKEQVDLNKMLVTAVRGSFSTLQKQSRELRRESARLQAQQDKERAAAEKAKAKEEQTRLRSIQDQMKSTGTDKLPGLLAFCGSWIKTVREFKTLPDFKAAAPSLDVSQPFIITNASTLVEEESESRARVNFTLFKVCQSSVGRFCKMQVNEGLRLWCCCPCTHTHTLAVLFCICCQCRFTFHVKSKRLLLLMAGLFYDMSGRQCMGARGSRRVFHRSHIPCFVLVYVVASKCCVV